MHHGFDRGYGFLLSRLIPRRILSRETNERISRALSSGERIDLVRESWNAMEELVRAGRYRRVSRSSYGGETSFVYADGSGASRITLVMSPSEWERISGGAGESEEMLPSVLAGIISALSLNGSSRNLSSKIESILDLAARVIEGARARVAIFMDSEARNIRPTDRVVISSLAEEGPGDFYGEVLASGEPHVFIGPDGVARYGGVFEPSGDVSSMLFFPLRSEGRIYGVLEVHSPAASLPAMTRLKNVHMIGKGIVRLLDNNRQLEKMVATDRLTGINNRNNYETQLPLEMERATRNRKCLGFLIMDIDDFKSFNDTYGHDVGDRVLRLVAQTVRKHLRKIDQFFRYGGEEFIALLPGTGRDAAERTAERIREKVAEASIDLGPEEELAVTVTIGGCVYPVDAGDETELFRKADQAMIRAKRSGKNRVAFYEGG